MGEGLLPYVCDFRDFFEMGRSVVSSLLSVHLIPVFVLFNFIIVEIYYFFSYTVSKEFS